MGDYRWIELSDEEHRALAYWFYNLNSFGVAEPATYELGKRVIVAIVTGDFSNIDEEDVHNG